MNEMAEHYMCCYWMAEVQSLVQSHGYALLFLSDSRNQLRQVLYLFIPLLHQNVKGIRKDRGKMFIKKCYKVSVFDNCIRQQITAGIRGAGLWYARTLIIDKMSVTVYVLLCR